MIYPQRSLGLDSDYWRTYCKRIFNVQLAPPAIDYAHEMYGDTNMEADNIFFTNSAEDPWQFAGMRYLQDPEGTQKNLRTHYIDCPNCGHCSDLKIDSDNHKAVVDAQATVTKQIKAWMGL